ncbi:MAG TPA: stage V sporulation protein AE [Bacillota bacterium]|nr:stage V sporulation protein AE [Bacillota bacterium]
MQERRKVIVVTDGDKNAREAVEVAAGKVKARCISVSEGNPSWLSGPELVELITQAPYDPVVVMVDDKGDCHKGYGEKLLEYLDNSPDVEIIGAVAVASNEKEAPGIKVDYSVSQDGYLVKGAVSKTGVPYHNPRRTLKGDTVGVLKDLDLPVVIGTGDTGKMDGLDSMEMGAPITTKALEEILHQFKAQHGEIGQET